MAPIEERKPKRKKLHRTQNGEALTSAPKVIKMKPKKEEGVKNGRNRQEATTSTKKRNKKPKLDSQREDDCEAERNTIAGNGGSKKKSDKNKGRASGGRNDPSDNVTSVNRAGKGRVTDPRFASVHSDPRFQRMPKQQSKIPIDSRFSQMFSEERFASFTAPVDKRGKPRRGKRENPLLHYYIHQKEPTGEEDGSDADAGKDRAELVRAGEVEDVSSSSSGSDSSTDSSTSTDDEDEDDDDQCSVNSDVAHYLMASHEDTPQTEDATHRLAAVNMDWDHIKAVDLYVVMNSCLPKDGHINSVTIYPSEFGTKCLEIEATQGPSCLITGKEYQEDSDEDDAVSDEEGNKEIENEKLRVYELNRLKYYYAVVDCDSSATADHLYTTLDGTELLRTSNVFDLRFIPDSMEFPHPPQDMTSEAPTSYKEPDFHTRALQHSNVTLSWEEEVPERKKVLRRKFDANQLDELEFKDFLASDGDDSDDEENAELSNSHSTKDKKGDKYLSLLQSGGGSDGEGDTDGDDQDMEITFNTGLEDIAKRAREKKENKSETVWEAVLRKQKEKRKARKKNAKYSSEDDGSDSDHQKAPYDPDEPDDFFIEEPSQTDFEGTKKGSLKASSNKVKENKRPSQTLNKEEEASRAELELLCASSTNRLGSPLREDDTRPENVKLKKGARRKENKMPSENKLPKEDSQNDPRFAALFNSHLFALDPTDPQFKRSATYVRQTSQKQKHDSTRAEKKKSQELPPDIDLPQENDQDDKASSKKENAEILSMVKSLKRRTGSLKLGKKNR